MQDVPSSLVVRTPHSYCQGLGSIPGQGTKTPQGAWHGQWPQRDLPVGLPIGLTLGAWPWHGMKNATRICPNGRSVSHNIQSHTQILTSTTVRKTATPNPASVRGGSRSPFPTALQTPNTSRSTSETPYGKLNGQQRWGFRTKQGYPVHGHE